jgi:hypothetical protein
MTDEDPPFRRGVVRPMECYRQGWELIKENYWLFLGIALVAVILASIAPLYILVGPCFCGLYLCYLLQLDKGKKPTFDSLFKGFDYFVQSLIATLLWIVPLMVFYGIGYILFIMGLFATMPGPKAAKAGGPPPAPPWELFAGYGIFLLVFFVLTLVIHIAVLFTYPLIADRKLLGPQALRVSFRAVGANLGGVVGLVLLQYLFNILGTFACCVGAIFVLPINFAATAVAYRAVFPKEVEDDEYPVSDV